MTDYSASRNLLAEITISTLNFRVNSQLCIRISSWCLPERWLRGENGFEQGYLISGSTTHPGVSQRFPGQHGGELDLSPFSSPRPCVSSQPRHCFYVEVFSSGLPQHGIFWCFLINQGPTAPLCRLLTLPGPEQETQRQPCRGAAASSSQA